MAGGGEDLDVQVAIRAFLDASGFEDAQRRLAGLSDAAARSKKPLTDFAQAQHVSSREVKILTRELLYSVGATEGAGSAGRLAAHAFMVMGDSAEFANLALAGFGFGLAFILPRIIEWATNSETAAEAQKEIASAVAEADRALRPFYDTLKDTNTELAAMAKESHDIALKEQSKRFAVMATDLQNLEDRIDHFKQKAVDQFFGVSSAFGSIWDFFDKGDKDIESLEDKATKLRNAMEIASLAAAKGLTSEEYLSQETAKGNKIHERRKSLVKDQNDAYKEQAEGFIRVVEQEQAARAKDEKADDDARRKRDETSAEEFIRNRQAEAKAADQYLKDQQAAADQAAQATLARQTLIAQSYGQIAGALSSLFGKNKALAIAGAVIDTYAAANQVLRDPSLIGTPYLRWALAAAAIATGLANVSSIQKQEVGFDNPFADTVARQLGGTSAKDFVEHFGSAFVPGVRSGMAGMMMGGGNSTTIDRRSTVHVTANGIVGDRMAFRRWFEREMVQAVRVRERTSLGRT